jgi:biotin transport system substrate-specific component
MSTAVSPSGFGTFGQWAGSSLAKQALLVVGGSAFLAVMSQIAVGYPVPTTLQTLGVMLIGLTFGFRLATATLVAYLAGGAAGLPFFAPFGAGTSGYLIGFLLAAALIGYLADRGFTRSWPGTIAALFAGEAVIFGLGVTWLSYAFNMSAREAVAAGLTPFIVVDAIKLALAALIGKGVLKGASQFAKP